MMRSKLSPMSGLVAVALVSAAFSGACRPKEPDSPTPVSDGPGGQPSEPGGADGSAANSAISELLSQMDDPGGSSGSAPAQGPAPSMGPAPASTGDTFMDGINRVRSKVPTWNNGTGLVAKFLKESTGKHLSLIYVDTAAPRFNSKTGLWLIHSKALADDKVVGHFMVMLKKLQPGTYHGSPQSKDVVMASMIGANWNGNGPDTSWSIEKKSWCQITLKPGRASGDLEGTFKAKLVTNSGNSYHTIDDGYIYINR